MTNHDLFASPKKHLRWADKAFDELEQLRATFGREAQHTSIIEFNPETGEHTAKVRVLSELPDDIPRKATEVLLHSRHSFDQSLRAAMLALNARFSGTTHYPWSTSPKDLCGKIRTLKAKIKGAQITESLWDTIRHQEPYGTSDTYAGGNDLVRDLSKVANSKHDIGLGITGFCASSGLPRFSGGPIHDFTVILPNWDPVKNEIALFSLIAPHDIKIEYHYTIQLSIVISDSRLGKPARVLGALHAFRTFAKRVLEDFERVSC